VSDTQFRCLSSSVGRPESNKAFQLHCCMTPHARFDMKEFLLVHLRCDFRSLFFRMSQIVYFNSFKMTGCLSGSGAIRLKNSLQADQLFLSDVSIVYHGKGWKT
jgi:hypothetical protein